MISLFLDTCVTKITVYLCKDDKIITKYIDDNKNDLSEKLLPIINKILEENNFEINDVDRIIVSNGPGSFTGVRIGVTVAKVLAWGLNKKIITLSELFVLSTTKTKKKYIVPFIDARREFVYGAMYDNKGKNIIPDQYVKFEELLDKVKQYSQLGEIEFVSYDNNYNIEKIDPDVDMIKILKIADKINGINPHLIKPNYLKLTEAEEKLNDCRND